MSPVTAAELRIRCPSVLIECLGKRLLAKTHNSTVGLAVLSITDPDTLSKLKNNGTFVFTWEEVADAMNHGRPIFLDCY